MNNYFKILLITSITHFSIALSPQVPPKVIQEIEFKPHMVEHLIKGCPENSECSSKMGDISEKFKNTILKGTLKMKMEFADKHGLPFTFWTTLPKENDTITYQSKCNFHHPQKDKFGKIISDRQPIYEGIRFLKSTKNLKDSQDILPNIMLKEGQQKPIIIPRHSLPFYTNGDAIFFQQEFRGVDFKFKVENERVSLYTAALENHEIQSAACSKELLTKFKEINSQKLYQSAYCKLIYDVRAKKYFRYIFGWSC
ncbi:hypothetical protein M902_2756 [Bacteriovorax sp. BAL6_X]|uniref:hypothetical protein n=1 Tax=Bacteriovorax sp. BAL6_X TaxID=1201290 RepID=UPI000385996F|nr:hypothetical protein [Bacteriovorax sp. BAL6_X]EPZ51142.1 hypothetical protein M902_2756 [Bacteriovorax sp. BAL6_X]